MYILYKKVLQENILFLVNIFTIKFFFFFFFINQNVSKYNFFFGKTLSGQHKIEGDVYTMCLWFYHVLENSFNYINAL